MRCAHLLVRAYIFCQTDPRVWCKAYKWVITIGDWLFELLFAKTDFANSLSCCSTLWSPPLLFQMLDDLGKSEAGSCISYHSHNGGPHSCRACWKERKFDFVKLVKCLNLCLTSSLVYASFSVFQCSIVSLAHDQSVCCQIQFHSIDRKRPLCDALVYKNTEKRFMVFVLAQSTKVPLNATSLW